MMRCEELGDTCSWLVPSYVVFVLIMLQELFLLCLCPPKWWTLLSHLVCSGNVPHLPSTFPTKPLNILDYYILPFSSFSFFQLFLLIREYTLPSVSISRSTHMYIYLCVYACRPLCGHLITCIGKWDS